MVLILVSVLAIVVTLWGVERQRHGEDGMGSWPWGQASTATDSDWLTELYQTQCPTSSAKRAELWSEINNRGMPVFVWCLMAALSVPMLWLIARLAESEIMFVLVNVVAISVPLAATPTFGIQIKQGISYMSTFDATRPLPTAWLTAMKISVAVVSMLAGISVVATSFWFSAPLVDGFVGGVEVTRQIVINYLESAPFYQLVIFALVKLVQLVTIILFMASLHTTYSIYSDRLTFTVLGFILYACLVPIALVTRILPVSFGVAHVWLATIMIALAAVYFIRQVSKYRILSPGQISTLVIIWVLYALGYYYLLWKDGLLDADIPVPFIVFRTGICVSTLTLLVMAPWSLAMARHR